MFPLSNYVLVKSVLLELKRSIRILEHDSNRFWGMYEDFTLSNFYYVLMYFISYLESILVRMRVWGGRGQLTKALHHVILWIFKINFVFFEFSLIGEGSSSST